MELLGVSYLLALLISFCSSQSQNGNLTTLNKLKCTAPARRRIPNILRGVAVPKGDYPWHAAIFKNNQLSSQYFCGGTLISSNTVLTAAHCLLEDSKKLSPDTLIVRFGVTRLYFDGEGHEVHMVIPHTLFNDYNYRHDIGVLRLKTTVEFTNFIRPACLTNENFNIVNVDAFIPGFGSSATLNMAVMPGRSTEDCKTTNGNFFHDYVDSDYNFCAGHVNGTTIGGGDSGGGLVFERSDGWYIRGIASITAGTATGLRKVDISKFAVFTDIQSHFQWIIENSGVDAVEEVVTVEPVAEFSCSPPSGVVKNFDSKERNGSYPWHSTIFLPDGTMYGATIIREDVILTLNSNSLSRVQLSDIKIKVGRRQQIDETTIYKARSMKVYNLMTFPNQLVLIRLDRKLIISNEVKPVCTTNVNFRHFDITEWIPGFENQEVTDNGVVIRSGNSDCTLGRVVKDTYIYCADVATIGKILRGTGLVYEFNNGFYIRGIYMAVIGYKAFVFDGSQATDVTFFYDWIQNSIKELA